MGVIGKGLSVDGVMYFRDVIQGRETFECMEFSRQIAKLTGNYTLLNLATGYDNLSTFLFRVPSWPIGGIYFDGIMQTEHVSRIKPTQYPVQIGVQMTDHAIVEPSELTIDVMMSDAETKTFVSTNPILNSLYQVLPMIGMYNNFASLCSQPAIMQGEGRAAATWLTLKQLQISRTPITVETRLQTYINMVTEELSAPDDVKTFHAFRCTVRLREIFFAEAAESQTSARAAATKNATNAGQQPVQTGDGVNKTAAKAGAEKLGVG